MGILELFILAVGLSMDAFAVSICKGLSLGSIKFKHMVTAGLWFGGFQALMPVIGYLLGSNFADMVSKYAHWIAFALLVFIGRYFTRAPRLTVVFSLLKTTVLHPNFGELPHKILTLGLTAGDLLIVAAGILIVHIVEFFEERGTDVRGWLNARKSSVQVLILLASLLILAFFGIFRSGYISSEFIYGQF